MKLKFKPTDSIINDNNDNNDTNDNDNLVINTNPNVFSYNQYLLSQLENYKEKINKNLDYILDKYVELIIDYIKFITEKINIKRNYYYRFIFVRGLDTITSVFKIMLYYTKNVDLTYYHSQKAFYFYVEFIEQISTDQNSFLQLSSREASLFVYKKTIFEINIEIKKNVREPTLEEKDILIKLDNFIDLYKHLVLFFLKDYSLLVKNNVNVYDNNNDNNNLLLNACDSLKIFNKKVCNYNIFNEEFKCLHLLLDKLFDDDCNIINVNVNVKTFFEIIESFFKKLSVKKDKDKDIYEHIYNKILTCENIQQYLYLNNSKVFLNWIFS